MVAEVSAKTTLEVPGLKVPPSFPHALLLPSSTKVVPDPPFTMEPDSRVMLFTVSLAGRVGSFKVPEASGMVMSEPFAGTPLGVQLVISVQEELADPFQTYAGAGSAARVFSSTPNAVGKLLMSTSEMLTQFSVSLLADLPQ